MTAEDFADLVGARLVELGKWVTQCPAHGDYHAGLVITKGYKGTAKVECIEGCSIHKILRLLGLTTREYESWPVPQPNLFEMEIDELKAFYAKRRERQARHADACAEIRKWQREVNSIKEEIRSRFNDRAPHELKRNLVEAERKLSTAKSLEVDLRDTQPSSCSENSSIAIRSSSPWLW